MRRLSIQEEIDDADHPPNQFIGSSCRPFGFDGNFGRTWVNRGTYIHPYGGVTRYNVPPPAERHEMIYRSPQERDYPHSYGGGRGHEEHERRGR